MGLGFILGTKKPRRPQVTGGLGGGGGALGVFWGLRQCVCFVALGHVIYFWFGASIFGFRVYFEVWGIGLRVIQLYLAWI